MTKHSMKKWREENPERDAALWEVQDGRCGICSAPLVGRIASDHDHDTDEGRGLLCYPCNSAEGMIKASGMAHADWARALLAYLENPPSRTARLI